MSKTLIEVIDAFKDAGIEELNELQKKAMDLILKGKNLLIVAPTGSGKTEAAVIPIFKKIIDDRYENGIKFLYITPLRALNRDIVRKSRLNLD